MSVVVEYINGLFERRAVPYRIDPELKVRFLGDRSVSDVTVAPALAALADDRLAGARAEFEDAVAKLYRAQPKDLEDAIEESRKAVESTMKVLLVSHHASLPAGKKTVKPLHDALVAAGLVDQYTDTLISAAPRVANANASHGAGGEVRRVEPDLAAAVVAAAGVAITFLAGRLP